MPIVAATLVAASSTGMPAAISAPKASSISSSVTGRLMPSAEREVLGDPVVDGRVDARRRRPRGPRSSGWSRLRRRAVTAWSGAASSWSRGELDGDSSADRSGFHCGPATSSTPCDAGACRRDLSRRRDLRGLGRVEARRRRGRDQDALGLGVGRSRPARPSRRRGRTRRAGSRRRWSPGSGPARPGRRRPRRTRTRRRSRARVGGAPARGAQREPGRAGRGGCDMAAPRSGGLGCLQPRAVAAPRSGAPGPGPRWCQAHCPRPRRSARTGAMTRTARRPAADDGVRRRCRCCWPCPRSCCSSSTSSAGCSP